MCNNDNIMSVASLQPDYMGFIFYRGSPRYAGHLNNSVINSINPKVSKTGVFVNESLAKIRHFYSYFRLQNIQLHGSETPGFCSLIKESLPHSRVIKTISVSTSSDIEKAVMYEDNCDYILFDTRVHGYGGGGKKFNWKWLRDYPLSKPFFIGGGVEIADFESILEMKQQGIPLFAMDMNSGLESSPGIKDIEKVKLILSKIKAQLIQP